jgi:3-oxoadipate enol-lactonase
MSTQAAPDRFIEIDAVRLRWRVDGAGPALVLLHGWALDLDYWRPLVPWLAGRFTLLRFDRRGFGLSGGVPDPARDVADLSALMEEAGVPRALLVGMSQGTRLALRFAQQMPDRTHALVLDGAPALDAEPELPLDALRALLQTAGTAALHAALRAHPLMRLSHETPSSRQLLDEMLSRYRGLDLLHPAPALAAPDVAAIDAPTLVLSGSHDTRERRQAALALLATLRRGTRTQLAEAGHLALLDAPGRYAQAVSDFARGLPDWPAGL